MIGTTVSHYRITAKLGEGGMGEVYRAHDERLDRDVAIKVLPEEVAQDEARLARFEREAKLLASLNHQNIATLYGLEEVELTVIPSEDRDPSKDVILRSEATKNLGGGALSDRHSSHPDPSTRGAEAPLAQDDSGGVRAAEEATRTIRFLVMELAEGETLAERIKKGPVPVDDALPIALQIAEGLEAAHEQGIIHRDLKPANVMLSPEGKVKILDFGLAKAWAPDESDADITHSPTLTAQMTAAGVLLGTAAYMSPEQARGKPVDKRADIWAFGCVLWEILTGERLFTGDTVTDVLASIITGEPDWDALPETIPFGIRRLLQRCLDKDPHNRLRDIGEARLEIKEPATLPSEATAEIPASPRLHPAIWLAVGLLVGGILVAVVGFVLRGQTPAQKLPVRFTIDLPASEPRPLSLAFSPDGTHLVWAGSRLYHRRLDQLEAMPIPGTEGATAPFFSPDGAWVGFVSAAGELSKVPIGGGSIIALAEALEGLRATWSADDTIVFTNRNGSICRVSAYGGEPNVLTTVESGGAEVHFSPQLLPGSRALLYHRYETSTIYAQRLESGQTTEVTAGLDPRYLSSGYLVFMSVGKTMFAAPFDPNRLRITGPAAPVLDSVPLTRYSSAPIAFSQTGSLAYVTAPPGRLVWVDHDGITTPVAQTPGQFRWPSLSPDQQHIAVAVQVGAGYEVWLYDLRREAFTGLAPAGGIDLMPRWTRDGKWVTTSSARIGEPWNLVSHAIDGSGREERLTTSPRVQLVGSWSTDGRLLAFAEIAPETAGDILVMARGEQEAAQSVLRTPAVEMGPVFSPDGRWLAYSSDESGRQEVYVTPFPEADRRVQISTDGGRQALWAPDGEAIYYRNGDRMMAVSITAEPSIKAGKPEVLFTGSFEGPERTTTNYDITADGERFLMVEVDPEASQIVVVVNWLEELKRLVPTE